jgi:hypothetical protein
LRYGIVLRFLYPYGIPDTVDQSTLNFVYHDGTKWSSFSQAADRSVYTKYVSQSSNEFLEFKKLNMNLALVAKVGTVVVEESTPVEQSTPVDQSKIPQESVTGSTSTPEQQEESSNAVSLSIKLATLFLGIIALVGVTFAL